MSCGLGLSCFSGLLFDYTLDELGLFCFGLFVLDCTYKRDHMGICLSLSDLFHLAWKMPLRYFLYFYVFALKSLIQLDFLVDIFVISLDTRPSVLIASEGS